MVRIAKKTDYKKLEELKKMIDDENYLERAIDMIAQNLTKSIIKEES